MRLAVCGSQGLQTPCAHRLGERTKRRRLGRANVASGGRPADSCSAGFAVPGPGPRNPPTGVSVRWLAIPRAFRGLDFGSIMRPTCSAGRHHRGARAPSCDDVRSLAPFREENNQRPRLGPVTFTHRCDSRPRRASRPFLERAPRRLESTSTTNITFRALASNTLSGVSLPGAVGNPPASSFEAALSAVMSPSRSQGGAAPTCADPASGSSTLDGVAPASGRKVVTAGSPVCTAVQSSRFRASCSGASPAFSAA